MALKTSKYAFPHSPIENWTNQQTGRTLLDNSWFDIVDARDALQVIVAADVFPRIFTLLKDTDPMVRRNAASVAREVCKHTPELAQLIVATGGVAALVDNISEVTGNERLPGTYTHLLTFHPYPFWAETIIPTVESEGGSKQS